MLGDLNTIVPGYKCRVVYSFVLDRLAYVLLAAEVVGRLALQLYAPEPGQNCDRPVRGLVDACHGVYANTGSGVQQTPGVKPV